MEIKSFVFFDETSKNKESNAFTVPCESLTLDISGLSGTASILAKGDGRGDTFHAMSAFAMTTYEIKLNLTNGLFLVPMTGITSLKIAIGADEDLGTARIVGMAVK